MSMFSEYPFKEFAFASFAIVVSIPAVAAILFLIRMKYKKYSNESRYYATVLMLFVVLTCGAVALIFNHNFKAHSVSETIEHWGQFGDFFGGVLNPFLAFCSFMALLYTINIQSKQLTISTEELTETRKELTASRQAQERSSAALDGQLQNLKVQQFEATFFKLLENLRHATVKVEVNINELKNHILNPTVPGGMHSSGMFTGRIPEPFLGETRWKDARVALQSKETSGFYLMANSVRSALSFIKHAETDLSLSPHFYVEQVLNSLTTDMLRLIVVWCFNYEENEFRELVVRYHFFANLRMQSHDILGHGLPISDLALDMKAFEIKESCK